MDASSPAANVDPHEVAKFSALAARWWDADGPMAALHRMNPTRLAYIRDRASAHFGAAADRTALRGLRALDIGCGGGLATLPLARLGAAVTGLDASDEAIAVAKAKAAAAGLTIHFETATAEALVERGAPPFDLVVALEIIEHVPDPAAFLEAAGRLTRPGGLLIVATINRTPKARALAIVAAERVLKWAEPGTHDYDKLVRPSEITAALPGFHWDPPVGVTFSPLSRAWRLSDDASVNYMIAGVRPD